MAKLKSDEVERKLKEVNGNFAAVGRALGVSRVAVWKFVRSRPALQAVATDLRETMKDNAESVLYAAVLAGEPWAIQFYLRTQAKDRGYVERTEHDHRGEVRQRVIEEVMDSTTGGETLPTTAGSLRA
jgi:hypothetical protein